MMLTWLLVGHLVGDWLLQNDWMAYGKKQALVTLAGMVHFTIYTVTILGVLWLCGDRDFSPIYLALSALIIFVSHWLIDATSMVENWLRFYGQRNVTMMRIMVDQTLHVVVLALLSAFLLNR